jgi:hypothetical protein
MSGPPYPLIPLETRARLRRQFASEITLGVVLLEGKTRLVAEGEWGAYTDSHGMTREHTYLVMQLAAQRKERDVAIPTLVDELFDLAVDKAIADLRAMWGELGHDERRNDGPLLERLLLQAAAAMVPEADLSDTGKRWWER